MALGGFTPTEAEACTTCANFSYLCCDIPADDEFYLTSFEGEGMACGGYADGVWYYSTSWPRWYCGAKLQITNPANGACAVVEVADAGPAAWVEENAGKPIVDASTQVCRDLFDSSSCGWSDHRLVEVVQVDDDTPTGPGGCTSLESPLDAEWTNTGAEMAVDPEGIADFYACAGDSTALWFEVRNIGSATWVDVNASGAFDWGQAVRIGVPAGLDDPFTDADRISVNDASNSSVVPAGGVPESQECYDQANCQRTRFTVFGSAPVEPGVYVARWQLIDEGRDWFGPEMVASVRVESCTPPEDDCPEGDCPDDEIPDEDPGDDPGSDPDPNPDDGPPAGGDDDPSAGGSSEISITGSCRAGHGGEAGALPAFLLLLVLCLSLRGRR